MKFNRTLLAASLAAAILPATAVADALTVYGKLNIEAGYADIEGESESRVKSNSSRLGVKGDWAINDSTEIFYLVEYEVDTGSESKDNFKARNQFVGLRGDFGAISAGREDTMLKKSQGKVDLFSDYSGDIKNLFEGENREEQTVSYLTPSFSNFKAGVTWVAEGSASSDKDGFSVAAMYGDAKLKKTPFYAAVAYDTDVDGFDSIARVTAQTKIAGIKIGGMYQQQDETGDDSQDGFMISAAYTIDMVTLKTQFQDMECEDRKDEACGDSWSIGADYKLSKPTKLYAYYTDTTFDDRDAGVEDNDSFFGLGIEHKF